jgi:hypothetical protein
VLKKQLTTPAVLLEKKQHCGRLPRKTGLIVIIAFFAVISDIEPLGLSFLRRT